MRRFVVILVLLMSLCLFAIRLRITYFTDDFAPVQVETNVDKSEDVMGILFEKLANPPDGLKTVIPKDVLNAYFFVETALVLDLKSSALRLLDFDRERYFLHQVLFNIFDNYKALSRVYIIVDGKRRETLVNFVDTRYSFPKEIWSSWPVETFELEARGEP